MKCQECGAEVKEPTCWPRVLQNMIFMIVLLVGYQLTLSFVVSRYEGDELRNGFLLVANVGVAIISAYLGKKGFEKFTAGGVSKASTDTK